MTGRYEFIPVLPCVEDGCASMAESLECASGWSRRYGRASARALLAELKDQPRRPSSSWTLPNGQAALDAEKIPFASTTAARSTSAPPSSTATLPT